MSIPWRFSAYPPNFHSGNHMQKLSVQPLPPHSLYFLAQAVLFLLLVFVSCGVIAAIQSPWSDSFILKISLCVC